MKVIALKGDPREGLGKSATKKVRSEGKVPCVIYGKGENHHFSFLRAASRIFFSGARFFTIPTPTMRRRNNTPWVTILRRPTSVAGV